MPERLRRIAVLTRPCKTGTRPRWRSWPRPGSGSGVELLMPPDEAAQAPDDAVRRGYTAVAEPEVCATPTSASCSAATAPSCAASGACWARGRARARRQLRQRRLPRGAAARRVGGRTRRTWSPAAPRHRAAHRGRGRQRAEHHARSTTSSSAAWRHGTCCSWSTRWPGSPSAACSATVSSSPRPPAPRPTTSRAAGPIVEWDAGVLVLNFIAPHSLGFRPVDPAAGPRHQRPQRVARCRRPRSWWTATLVGRLCCGDEVRVAAGPAGALSSWSDEGSFYQNVEEKLFDRRDAR